MSSIKGTNVLAPVVPFDTTDAHASHEARYGKGGYRSVADIAERDAIPQLRREAGMLVLTLSDGVTWRLANNLTSWTDYSVTGPVGPQGPQGVPGVAGATGPQGTPGVAGGVGPQGPAGSAGVAGVAGVAGATGATGSTGAAGPANTLAIGTVTSGSSAAATITGSSPSQTLNLVLPRGEAGNDGAAGATGSQGIAGSTGPAGPANSLSIGTVTEGAVGATITGTSPSQVLNLVLPRGNTGAAGATGSQGIQGMAGSTGAAGPANTLSIGTVSSGETAAATITGASPSQTLNLVLPKGDTGSAGVAGATGSVGPQGPAGVAGATGAQGPQASLVYASVADFPATGSSTALYLAEDTSRLYQWESPVYVEVGTSGGGIATTSASDLTSGTLADARLSATVTAALTDSRTPTDGSVTTAKLADGSITTAKIAANAVITADIADGAVTDTKITSMAATKLTGLMGFFNSSATVIDTLPRNIQNIAHGVTSGSMLLTFFTPLVTQTITQITVGTGANAASGLTLARLGLYTWDETNATLVAAVASDTTLCTAANTVFTRSLSTGGGLPSSYTLTAGSRYGLALLVIGTTMPTIIGLSSSGFNVAPLSPRTNGQIPSQTNLAATFAAGNIAVTTNVFYARLS